MSLDKDKLPTIPGIYLVKETGYNSGEEEVEVYEHSTKGLCCYSEDIGSSGTGVNDETDCHVSVQCTGIKFIKRLRV